MEAFQRINREINSKTKLKKVKGKYFAALDILSKGAQIIFRIHISFEAQILSQYFAMLILYFENKQSIQIQDSGCDLRSCKYIHNICLTNITICIFLKRERSDFSGLVIISPKGIFVHLFITSSRFP